MHLLGGSNIITLNIAHKGGQYFQLGLIILHSLWMMQDTRSDIFDAPLTLIFGGRDIDNNKIAHIPGKCFHYGLMFLNSPWIM
jgi:hypothetical protein